MNTPACFMCRRAASWRGVVGTRRCYACDLHRGWLQLQVVRHPFQSSVVARESGTVRAAWSRPVELVPSDAPGRDNFSGDAA